MTAYKRRLSDVLDEGAMHFTREDGVESTWAVVQGVLGNEVPTLEYEPGSWGPVPTSKLAVDIGG